MSPKANAITQEHVHPISSPLLRDAGLVVSASVLMALCAHASLPLVFSPVPLTMQPFGVLVIALLLGPRRAFAALALYLMEGASGLPVFSPAGPGGVAQLLGPTGGFLMASPIAAYGCAFAYERIGKTTRAALAGAIVAEITLFAFGLTWLMGLTRTSLLVALNLSVWPYLPGEVLKVAAAVAIAASWRRWKQR